MDDKIKREREQKLNNTLKAASDHVQNALSAIQDANLYSTEDQEAKIDSISSDLRKMIVDIGKVCYVSRQIIWKDDTE